MPRFDRLYGIGRIRVYDNGGKTVDRYLVLFEDMEVESYVPGTDEVVSHKPKPYGERQSLSMSPNPDYPQGVSLWGEDRPPPTWSGSPDGMRWRRIPFASLPANVQRHIVKRAGEV